MPTHARDRLLAAAGQLFYAEGIRAVGVERLLESSGVGRASFYRHFASKDDLVVAMLRGYDERYRASLREAVDAADGDPLAVFDALATRFAAADYRGCSSINTMVEIADVDHPAHRVAAEHKRAVIDYLDGVLAAGGHDNHYELAEQFMLLIDGANVSALREHSAAPARRAKAVAQTLLDGPSRRPSRPGRSSRSSRSSRAQPV